MKILCLGDSLVANSGNDFGHWLKIVSHHSVHSYENCGVSGDTTSGMLARLHCDILTKGAQYCFILGGYNDLICGADIGIVQSNLMALVHHLYANKVIPVLGLPLMIHIESLRPDWTTFTDFNLIVTKMAALRQWVYKFCTQFYTDLIDFEDGFEDGGRNRADFLSDGLHPNDLGNDWIAKRFVERAVWESKSIN